MEEPMSTETAIRTEGLTKHFPGVQALSDLSIEVPAGSIYGFLGPNGAGKTTAIKILGGLIKPTSGSASVAGVPLSDGAPFRRQVGYLAQEPRFYDWMTARETLRFVGSLGAQIQEASWIDQVLARVGLTEAADRRTSTFSGGMRQRLGIAQALVTRPKVLLLDEPVSALDPIGRHEVLDLMSELKGEATVFYSTHILDDVQRVSDHVAILDQGRLVRSAPTAELLGSFTQDLVRVVLGGASDQTAIELAELAGVASVEPAERHGDQRGYLLRIEPNSAPAVQHAVMRFAADRDLTITENNVVQLDLEDVFLRLINKERAA
jgi:ABC-2 type transport system ATP-binding protein